MIRLNLSEWLAGKRLHIPGPVMREEDDPLTRFGSGHTAGDFHRFCRAPGPRFGHLGELDGWWECRTAAGEQASAQTQCGEDMRA
jgi:hypothetical protein